MALAINDRARVIFSMWLDGQLGINIRHYRVSAVGGVGMTEDAAANALFLDASPLYTALMSIHGAFIGVSVRDITQVPLAAAGVSDNVEEDGLVAGDPLPTQCCGLLKLRSNLAGRANRGRVYVPFPGEVDSDVSHIPIAGYMTRLIALGDYLAAPTTIGVAPDTLELTPIIRHASGGDVDVIGYTTRRAWATQRRRGTLGKQNPKQIAL